MSAGRAGTRRTPASAHQRTRRSRRPRTGASSRRTQSRRRDLRPGRRDRKSTRLNSSHSQISYAVFCLKKKAEAHLRPAIHWLSNATRLTRKLDSRLRTEAKAADVLVHAVIATAHGNLDRTYIT